MEHIGSHLGNYGEKPKKKERATERGELMQYFLQKLNAARTRDGLPPVSMARMGRVLVAIPTNDLYYLKSVCDDAAARGGASSFSKRFWWEVDPKKHAEGARGTTPAPQTPPPAPPARRASKRAPRSLY